MAVFLEHIEKFLSSPILWGITAIIAIALGLSGRFSVTASSILMWVAWAMASFGAYRIYVFYKMDTPIRMLATIASTCILAIAALLVVRWMNIKEVTAVPPLQTPTVVEHPQQPGQSQPAQPQAIQPINQTAVKSLALHTPIDLPNLTFSDSPIFTAQRRKNIQGIIGEFRTYLKNTGFDVSQQVFPISVVSFPGKVVGMGYLSPGDVYDGKIKIGKNALDDPASLRLAYSQFYFVTTIGTVRTAEGSSDQLEMVYQTYYLESFSGKPFIGHSEWNNALWDLRDQFGAKTTDKALCIGLQRRADSLRFKSANAYTANVIERGFEPFVNDVIELKNIDKTIEKYGLLPPSS
jgi:hypothetical protein